jgi:hypothetical protein
MEHPCPICQRALTKDDNNKHIDYHCYPPKSDHHYSKRVSPTNEILKMKVRMGSGESRLFFKINYDQGFTQVWTDPDNDESRIQINHIFEPDLTDLEALRQKLRTYMVFS